MINAQILPKWIPSKDSNRKHLGFPILLFFIILILWFIALQNIMGNTGSLAATLNFLISSTFLIYLGGRLYGEFQSHNDFINISSEGIKYRETPSFQLGWLPSNRSILFGEIKSVDMVSMKKMFNPNEESFGILLHLHQGRSKLIGTRLEQKQLMEIAFALKGSVMLTGSLKRILGEDATLKDVVDTARGFWNSLKQKTDDLNRRSNFENSD